MTTLQMTRPKHSQATGTWSSVFPVEQSTVQQSAQFVKKLLAVAVSNLTYLRAIFPEQAFGQRALDGLQLKVLRDDAGCPGAWQITQWIKACFDAIDKKYLRQLTVVLYLDPADPDTVIESYTFRFTYSSSGGVSMHHGSDGDGQPTGDNPATISSEETYKATVRMLRTIVVLTQTLRPLPDDVMMSMKLLYFDDVTPADYEPPGFRPAETHQIFFSTEPINVRVGDVSTPHHTVKLRLKTDKSQLVPAEGDDDSTERATVETVPNEEPERRTAVPKPEPEPELETESRPPLREPRPATEPSLAESVSGRSPGRPASAVDTSGTPAAGAAESDAGTEEPESRVLCVCGVHEDDGLMVLCELCRNWQHGICFLVLSEDEAPASHICDSCALDSGRPCTDARLPTLAKATRMATCLYRRGLCACEEMTRVQPARLAQRLGVAAAVAAGLMNRLDKDALLKPLTNKSRGTVRVVDKERLLNEAFPRYLNRPAPARRPAAVHQAQLDAVAEQAGRMDLEETQDDASPPDTPHTGPAGDGPTPTPRSAGRKRRATPTRRQDKHLEAADSQEFHPETAGTRGSKRFKASRTDGIAA